MTRIVEVKQAPNSDDLYVEIPEELLKKLKWKTGDVIDWKNNKDGTYTLRKLNVDKLEKRLAEIQSLFGGKDYVYSKNKHIEHFCIYLSRLKYNLTEGLYYKVKYFIQRHTRGYDELDKWNVAWYIARKAIPVLEAMRDGCVGTSIKWHREDRFGEIIELSKEEVYSEDEIPTAFTEEEWKAILNDIIFAFQYTLNQDNSEFDMDYYNNNYKRYKRGLKLFSIYYGNLWD